MNSTEQETLSMPESNFWDDVQAQIPNTAYSQRNFAQIRVGFQERQQRGLMGEYDVSPIDSIGRYLEAIRQKNPEYYSQLVLLSQQAGELSPETRCVYTVPFAGFNNQSQESLLNTLQVFSDQEKQSSDSIEVFCLNNKPQNVPFDDTQEQLDTFAQNETTHVRITSAQIELKTKEKSRPLMGKLRAMATDVTLLRIYQTSLINPELPMPILAVADDDIVWMNPQTTNEYLAAFEANSRLDLLIGELRFDSTEYPSLFFPAFYVADELMSYLPQWNKNMLNALSQKQSLTNQEIQAMLANIFSGSFTKGLQSNYAFRPEAYARAGGAFNQSQDVNELDYMVRMIALSGLRQRRCNIGALCEQTRVLSSSRRALLEFVDGQGRAPIEQWRGSYEIKVTDEARSKKPDIIGIIPLSELTEEDTEEITEELERFINKTLAEYKLPQTIPGWYQDIAQAYNDALARIGLSPTDYTLSLRYDEEELSETKIKLINAQTMIRRLSLLQEACMQSLGVPTQSVRGELAARSCVLMRPWRERAYIRDYTNDNSEEALTVRRNIIRLPLR